MTNGRIKSCISAGVGKEPNPMDLTSADLVRLACTAAKLVSVVCEVTGQADVSRATIAQADEPYIWDIPED